MVHGVIVAFAGGVLISLNSLKPMPALFRKRKIIKTVNTPKIKFVFDNFIKLIILFLKFLRILEKYYS